MNESNQVTGRPLHLDCIPLHVSSIASSAAGRPARASDGERHGRQRANANTNGWRRRLRREPRTSACVRDSRGRARAVRPPRARVGKTDGSTPMMATAGERDVMWAKKVGAAIRAGRRISPLVMGSDRTLGDLSSRHGIRGGQLVVPRSI